ncbi:hypothetical protein [Methylobacterium gnaphalii]|uniref:Chemotaxis protein CheZ n=1 Tax=Methylobacterium gnaphalii TaxID=1010610 RepID=A0A512JK14_9HYPH|nr:hypothetical protein [Methylobacterium gnaphalii]GEP10263.1 hypothetical protein MGN01_21080 [Methylobacterium gnaphalii]GJD68617.1 hypothetical protein MMMDOFMJ_1541 [Methylobacterium gnaphalii]GLS51344.1 hypothetical protein GCM10007885_42000 [Methylobacterium gnaphalii]
MMGSGSPSQLDQTEYDIIESALAESERGRRFLAEFARRHRGADTDTLLQAIHRLEGVVTRDIAPASEPDALHEALSAMADRIAQTRVAIAAGTPAEGGEGAAPDTLESFLHKAERATAEILGAAEAIQEAAWGLREKGADAELCDVLDRRAITIYTACSAQDLAAQRTGLLVETLCDLEARIAGQIGEAAAPASSEPSQAAAVPPPLEDEFGEHDLDFLPSETRAETSEPPAEIKEPGPAPVALREPDDDDLALAFGDLDRLSIEEKIALFS